MSMDIRRRVVRSVVAALMALAGATVAVWACGPWVIDLPTAVTIHPARADAYARGELGVIRPTYARRYLIQAYRVLNGRQPLGDVLQASLPQPDEPSSAVAGWSEASARVMGAKPPEDYRYRVGSEISRAVPGVDYQQFGNCLADSFATALRTLQERQARFGASSAEVREWTQGQVTVFENCTNRAPQVPAALPATAHPLLRADRDYQIASAYFYAMQYDEAARRFAAIAQDSASPWRPYGRYLVARARIRQATLPQPGSPPPAASFARADEELRAVLADPAAAVVHESARGLRRLIEDRTRPVARVHALSKLLVAGPSATAADLHDYTRLMDRLIGDTTSYAYAAIPGVADIVAEDDASDWLLALQGSGPEGAERAVQRWQATRSLPWLVAVLWRIPPAHTAVPAVLDAARAIDERSPAVATVAVLRVRLLAHSGRRDEARALLKTLPTDIQPGFDAETLNLLRAERLMLAETFAEFLANASRTAVGPDVDNEIVLDEDAGDLFTYHLPLDRMIDAAGSPLLPARTRVRVASAALARAIVLRQEDAGVRAAAALRALAPVAMHADIDRYVAAGAADARHRAGLLLLLRTPGMHAHVLGVEDRESLTRADPARRLDHVFRRNWWCVTEHGRIGAPYEPPHSATTAMLYEKPQFSAAAFLRPEEVATAAREVGQLRALGSARDYLAVEAINWARARPTDLDAAEALAQVVEGGRWNRCGVLGPDNPSATLSRRAFQTLHQLFPKSAAARRTKYWYQ